MKKFSKMLALVMALAFVFGMTVSAAESPVAGNPEGTAKAEASENIVVEAATETVVAAAEEATTKVTSDQIKTALDATKTYKVNKVVGVWNLNVSADGGQVIFTAPAPAEKQEYVLIHFQDDACTVVKEVLALSPLGNGQYSATVKSGSPFALVLVDDTTTPVTPPNNNQNNNNNNSNNNTSNNQQASQPAAQSNAAPLSPKTGETVPMMSILAVICLAGVCFCARKVSCNK